MRKKGDPYLRLQPWKVNAVYDPIERVLHRLEMDGTVDAAKGVPVFREDIRGGWYEMVPALRGVIEFHQLAFERYGIVADVTALVKLTNKLETGAPIFEADLNKARASINSCKLQALALRVSEADSVCKTVSIRMHMELQKVAA